MGDPNGPQITPLLRQLAWFIREVGLPSALVIFLILVITGTIPSKFLSEPLARIESGQAAILTDTSDFKELHRTQEKQMEKMTQLLDQLVKLQRAICYRLPNQFQRKDCE